MGTKQLYSIFSNDNKCVISSINAILTKYQVESSKYCKWGVGTVDTEH